MAKRIFVYDGRTFDDPDPNMSVEEVKTTLSDFFGEIATADVNKTEQGEDTVYEFRKRVGVKGHG